MQEYSKLRDEILSRFNLQNNMAERVTKLTFFVVILLASLFTFLMIDSMAFPLQEHRINK